MKKLLVLVAGFMLALLAATAQAATEKASVRDAESMVKKAIAFYQKNGRDRALAEFSKSPGAFVDRDVYVTVYAPDGNCLAHINPKMVNKNMLELRDPEGRYIIRDRVEAARSQSSGWQDITFFNPVSRKIEPKRIYWERHDNLVFAAGAYRPEE